MDLQALKTFYEEYGYVVVPGLFSADETQSLREHYTQLRTQGTYPGDFEGVDVNAIDPLKRYPRMIHMHRWDEQSLRWFLDSRINTVLTALSGQEPYAVQTMIYFKPPRARGQALHQDNYYLKAQPGTCMAAWLALDDCDQENGCMQVVPGSHRWPILCTEKADTKQSFTDVTVPIPAGQEVTPVLMKAGDMLFFGGSLVHGSYPNTSTDRFRRSLIGHYVTGNAEQVSTYSQPVLHMDGSVAHFETSPGGGLCGVWVEEDGKPVVELVGVAADPGRGVE